MNWTRGLLRLWVVASISGCSPNEGPYEGFLILQNERGDVLEFFLGGQPNFEACGEMAGGEAAAHFGKNAPFWTNPEFNYGGYREADDWVAYLVLGFTCRFNRDWSEVE